MCLYPRLIYNRKYKANKKNGGIIPPILDSRCQYVPIGCQVCIECRKQKAREWMVRLQEDIKKHKNGRFVTLTFSKDSIRKLANDYPDLMNYEGYEFDNKLCTQAVRLFLERWRKKYKKSLRHWLVSELGGGHSEHVHLHGILWTDHPEDIESKWGYGYVWAGYIKWGKLENYVNARTVNYIVKYINKIDAKHLNYKPVILTSAGIGANYIGSGNDFNNRFLGVRTNETYRTSTGHKMALPIYWRNKVYSEQEREMLWIQKLDKGERFVCGEKVRAVDSDGYYNLVDYHRARTHLLGYPSPDFIWSKKGYEEARRKMLLEKKLFD